MGSSYVKTKSHDLFEKSRCRGNWLHRFQLTRQFDFGVEERCLICGETVRFKVIDGRINNTDYISYHARNALPKQHNLFYHEYPAK